MIEFTISAMTCGHCIGRVTKAVKQADPNAQVAIDLPTHKVQVQTNEDRETIAASLAEAGYAPD
jgi:copper chaperone